MARIACVQSDVAFNDPATNAQKAVGYLQSINAELVVFPEAFLTGYCVSSREEAEKIAIEAAHPALKAIQDACEEQNKLCVVGFAEKRGDELFNTAVLFEPGQPARYYSKSHLPELGLDNYVVQGDTLEVFETRLGRLGVLICYDLRPPEASRVLALKGADLIVLPTNWPVRPGASPSLLANARAMENKIFFACTNRIGDENGFSFRGGSCIVDPFGITLAVAGDGEEVLTADLDLPLARIKRNVVIPGKFESDTFASRRPELYGDISTSS